MKRLAIVLGMLLLAGSLYAASDSFTVTVTPTGNRGVIIDSTTYNFSSLDANQSKISSESIPVTSTGTVSPLEYTIQGADAATWTLESDEVVTPSGENKVVLQAIFQDPNTVPVAGDFGATDTVTTAAQQVGDGSSEFEGTANMDDMGLLAVRHLYLRITTPPTTTTEAQQSFTITINAEAAD